MGYDDARGGWVACSGIFKDNCVAFNTNGWIKDQFEYPLADYYGKCKGVYIKLSALPPPLSSGRRLSRRAMLEEDASSAAGAAGSSELAPTAGSVKSSSPSARRRLLQQPGSLLDDVFWVGESSFSTDGLYDVLDVRGNVASRDERIYKDRPLLQTVCMKCEYRNHRNHQLQTK